MILITGADGQLGREITVRATGKGLLVRPLNRIGLDITDRRTVLDRVAESGARLVINAAAYNLVDRAETEPQAAHAVNADGPGHLAEACDAKGIPLIHISTDYVFGGEKNSPYTEDDPALPLSEYGRSKLAGEKNVRERLERHLIVRTAWLYGPHGRNFVTTMLRLAREREEIRVVNDQRGSPTAVPDLAEALLGLSENILAGRALPWGTYHLAGSQDASWFDLARASVAGGADRRLVPRTPILAIPSSEYPTPARRPAWSVLDGSRARTAFGLELAPWSRSLPRVLDRIAAFAKENS